MINDESDHVMMIEISSIKVINPRSRNKFRHGEITESIDKQGLRKPITVRRIDDDNFKYALICGQGRLESISGLQEKMIPAFIVDVDEETAYIMSLIENMARVNPRAGEQFYRIKEMMTDGASNKEIAQLTGLSINWINSIMMLVDRGESKLLAAVESGRIPISLAVEIAKSDYKGAQELFIEAFEQGKIKHKHLIKIRKILDERNEGLKGAISNTFHGGYKRRKLSADDLTKLYQENIDEYKSLKNKARVVEENILLAQQIVEELSKNSDFTKIVIGENLEEALAYIKKPYLEAIK